ncbi:ferritin-like protein [Streptomyces sp. NPDC096198]|uniref:ferritin-like domain-containing protein n=1 Tax=Streptomyces sp. NPDC096198 TaxID=3366080 RepID=UPI0038057485
MREVAMSMEGEDPGESATARLRRRHFLAATGAAAATSVTAAGPAHAAGPSLAGPSLAGSPFDGLSGAPHPGTVARLLAVPESGRGLDWLKASLQVALELELSTIPPYLCGWWSITDRGGEAARLIRRIVGNEMYHLGVVCNLLVAVGGRPRIRDSAPAYPGPLPGGVRPGVNVYLSGLTRSFVCDVMMAIEAPEEPLTRSADDPPSVGAFYGDLLNAFRATAPVLSARGQLSEHIGADLLRPVLTPSDVERSLEIIREQGEGTDSSPDDALQDDHPAHYYAFAEIYHGRRLRETGGQWDFTGTPVPFPDTRPMARVPAGGWVRPPTPVRRLLNDFDITYTAVLENLDAAWARGDRRALKTAVSAMHRLESPAVELMEIPISGGRETYGPQFRPV